MYQDYIIKDANGKDFNVSVIGFFKIPDLEKEFVMYSITDNDKANENGGVLLGEVIREDDTIKILGIKSDEKDLVVAYYNEISEQIGGEE